jgi:hypothetical protein
LDRSPFAGRLQRDGPDHTLSAASKQEDEMRRTNLAAGLFVLGLSLGAAAPAFAAFGAMALDDETGKYGASWNEDSQKRAEDAALKGCDSPGCKIVFRVPARQCGALATGEKGKSGKVAWGGKNNARTRDAAKLAALENCQKHTSGKCEVRESECNR